MVRGGFAAMTPHEREFFLHNGYLRVEGALAGDHLKGIQQAFDQVWEAEGGEGNKRVATHQLLKYRPFIGLIDHPPIVDLHRALFGRQTQLLSYDLLRQGPHSAFPDRRWHRDFSFPGDTPLAVNTIIFLDDINEQTGPTRVVPRTHLGEHDVPKDTITTPLEGEVAFPVAAGTAILINAAIWHTGARNDSDGLRRGIYMYYGYWWLKQYGSEQALPWQALEGASQERLELLGVKMPGRDLHMYDPTDGRAPRETRPTSV